MKKKLIGIFILLYLTGQLSAMDSFFLGLGPEISGHTRSGVAVGGVFSAGLAINTQFAAGVRASFFSDMDELTTLEPVAFFRYYLPLQMKGLFAQAEAGGAFFFEQNETFISISAGISAGWRYELNQRFYVEPTLRFGYPFMWGAGVIAGIQIIPGAGLDKPAASQGEEE